MAPTKGHRTKPSLGWRGDNWSPVIGNAIERRLKARRARLAELLDIDIKDREFQCLPGDPGNGRYIYRIDLAIDELTRELRTCWSLLREVNRAASSAQVYRTLEAIAAEPTNFVDPSQRIDPETWGWIEDHYPGGWMALDQGPVEPALLRDAAGQALRELPAPGRGRPRGKPDVAARKLAEALAETYAGHAVARPTRHKAWLSGEEEYGPYRDFVEEVMSVVPDRLRTTKMGGLKSVDHLVRIGVEHIVKSVRRA